ncbi:FK506-binding protein 11 [Mytilus galloprovincialis]|uniref:FK506-binding protein 11 n=1 Tax=Mytilus galloprovincialis TaxID=29158 RepID=A0A8B6FA67_MYTGA|nr:FK506-binding protein 11 [Mytilus galloprovincialis]
MFGQQTVLDGHPGASDGKILIKSELDIKTTYLPEDCTIVTKTGDTITLEYDVCSFLFSVTVSPNVTSAYDAYVNDEHKETSKETEGMPAGLLEFTIGKRMVVLANAMARFDIELVKIQGQSWADWYVEILQIVCGICFAAGAIALGCEKIREKKGGKKSK